MASTIRPLLQRIGAGQHLGLDQRSVFFGRGEAQGLGIDQQVEGGFEGHHGLVSGFECKFDLHGGRHQASPPLAADKVIAGLSAEPLRALQAGRDAVGAHSGVAFRFHLGPFRRLRELAFQLPTHVLAEGGLLRHAKSEATNKLLNSQTKGAAHRGFWVVFHSQNSTHRGLS